MIAGWQSTLAPAMRLPSHPMAAWLAGVLLAACVGLAVYDLWLLLSFAR